MTAPPTCERRWERSDSLELGAYPGAVTSARLHARAVLAEWQLACLADEAESVVAELVANAVEVHRREGLDEAVGLTLLADSKSALVVVRDSSNRHPVRTVPDFDDESGRGLLLVEAIADWWDWKPLPRNGKMVRSLITCHGDADTR